MVFQHVSDALLLLLHHNLRLVLFINRQLNLFLFLENRWRITCIPPLFYIFGSQGRVSHFFAFGVGCLYGRISDLFALPFVQLASSIDISYNIWIDFNFFLRIELLLLQHGNMQHPVLHTYSYFQVTLASLWDGVATTRILLESLLSSLDNFVERANINLPKLSLKMCVDNAVQFTQHLTQFRIEVVLHAIVSPA